MQALRDSLSAERELAAREEASLAATRRELTEVAEIQPRYSRDTAEIQPRYSRDVAEVQPRYS